MVVLKPPLCHAAPKGWAPLFIHSSMSVELSLDFDKASMALIQKHLTKLATGGLRAAVTDALKDTGHHARRGMGKHLSTEFDRPTPYIVRSPKFVLDEKKLALSILPTQDTRRFAFGGGQGKGLDAQHVLQAGEWGGQRHLKRFEIALSALGVLPSGMQTAIPQEPFPGSDDGRGNLRGPFTRRLLVQLQALRSASDAPGRGKKNARPRTGQLGGWQLMVIRAHTGKLPPGIWARQHRQIRPVVIFTRPGNYRARGLMRGVEQATDLPQYLQRRMRYRIRKAVGI